MTRSIDFLSKIFSTCMIFNQIFLVQIIGTSLMYITLMTRGRNKEYLMDYRISEKISEDNNVT